MSDQMKVVATQRILAVCLIWFGFLIFPSFVRAHAEIIEKTPEGYRYAVRLPEGYNKKQATAYPVIFCFHHRGDGVETTRILGYASYRLNWIIVGFMDFVFFELNKDSWPQVMAAQEAILKDAQQKYNVDSRRLYAAGFANGGRMAYTIAYRHTDQFKGIIACGAGLGLGEPLFTIPVYQCVGDDDFNLIEVERDCEKLKSLGVKVRLKIFKGGHQWPPQEIINEALEWISASR